MNYYKDHFQYLQTISHEGELFYLFVALIPIDTLGMIVRSFDKPLHITARVNGKRIIISNNAIVVNPLVTTNGFKYFLNFMVYHEIGHKIYGEYVKNKSCLHNEDGMQRNILVELFCDIFAIQSLELDNNELNIVKDEMSKACHLYGIGIERESRYRMSLWKKMRDVNIYNIPHIVERLSYNKILYKYYIINKANHINELYGGKKANELVRMFNKEWEHLY